ncbi:hypothetical protein RHSIM_Rhsim02G0219100 [Rhododendron simsii]|uniref:Uncharacterized protein n=1 Tax=Rhododendron simsii TaxID=118357 RepID=A0A834HIT2_RHOSS|nr:hypothetical protein RHSIM_Rhsim02G0219100 [Rhododendron simsii]
MERKPSISKVKHFHWSENKEFCENDEKFHLLDRGSYLDAAKHPFAKRAVSPYRAASANTYVKLEAPNVDALLKYQPSRDEVTDVLAKSSCSAEEIIAIKGVCLNLGYTFAGVQADPAPESTVESDSHGEGSESE